MATMPLAALPHIAEHLSACRSARSRISDFCRVFGGPQSIVAFKHPICAYLRLMLAWADIREELTQKFFVAQRWFNIVASRAQAQLSRL